MAAGNPEYTKVLNWIDDAWKKGVTFEELDDPGGHQFVMLDMKLANGMVAMMHKAGDRAKRFRDKVNLRMEEASRGGGNVLKGRQMVWMLLDSFKTIDNSELVYGFDHLARLKVNNHDLHDFVIQWNHIIDNLGGGPMTSVALRDVFYRKICDEEQMKYDMNLYERMREGDPSKSYKHLLYCVESVIKLQEQRKNILEKEALLSGRAPKAVEVGAAAPSDWRWTIQNSKCRRRKTSTPNKRGEKDQSPRGSRPPGKGKGKDKTGETGVKDSRVKETSGKGAKDGGKGKSQALQDLKKQPCRFFDHSTCRFGAGCYYSHEPMSELQKQSIQPPSAQRSPSTSSQTRATSPTSNAKDARKGGDKGHCFVFLQSGTCPRNQCPFLHITQKELDDRKKGSQPSHAAVCVDGGQERIAPDTPSLDVRAQNIMVLQAGMI